MSLRRRDILTIGSASAVAALAGCLGSTDDDTSGNDSTNDSANDSSAGSNQSVDEFETTDLGQDVSVDGTSVAVSAPDVRTSLVSETGRKEFALTNSVGSHYLLVRVDAGEGGPAPETFTLVTESSGNYDPSTPTNGNPLAERGAAYDPENGVSGGWLAFTVPGGIDYSSAAVAVDGTETGWALGEAVVSSLSEAVPSFTLESVDAPESVSAGTQFDVTVTVANGSSTDGTLRGLVDMSTPNSTVKPFSVDVAGGETATYTEQFFAPTTAEEVAFTLRTDGGNQSVSIAIEGGGANGTNASGNATNSTGN
ncbi:hypothetical protein [Halomarina oriensis]|uniref:Uncharacterized protein n=1 Tax=Halomarina oriensis TaxID=671145 RepID=A0A6B0GJT3_9EURY|nr:hypothetical protein [Halomarina oriensis]MWG35102.1 hypothetical protein [Halomarina oriensis]